MPRLRVLLLNWRDLHHPEAGGAEKYLVTVAEGLAARGHDGRCSVRPPTPAPSPTRWSRACTTCATAGTTRSTRGPSRRTQRPATTSWSTCRTACPTCRRSRPGRRWSTSCTTCTVSSGRSCSARAPLGSAGGSSPGSHRGSTAARSYVAVSDSTERELVELGVDAERVTIIHNGTDAVADDDAERSPEPRVIVLGRLVPQKRVELALDAAADAARAGARAAPRRRRLRLVGAQPARARRGRSGSRSDVTFHGHVSEAEKHRLLARAWVHAMPSLKEGWGLVVVEAGVHGTPTVAFRAAGGPADSIRDGETGLLVDDARARAGRPRLHARRWGRCSPTRQRRSGCRARRAPGSRGSAGRTASRRGSSLLLREAGR